MLARHQHSFQQTARHANVSHNGESSAYILDELLPGGALLFGLVQSFRSKDPHIRRGAHVSTSTMSAGDGADDKIVGADFRTEPHSATALHNSKLYSLRA